MVIVVPALTEGQQRQPDVVAAIVLGVITTSSETVRQRVDGDGGMEQHHRGDEKAPDQHLPACRSKPWRNVMQQHTQCVQTDGERDWNRDVIAIKPAQFRILRQIRHSRQVGAEVARGQKPADVAPQEPENARGMRVLWRVGVAMMMPMMGRPPQRSALDARRADQREYKLHRTRGLEGTMRKITMVEAGNGEHAHGVHRSGNDERNR
jgi:hypothetical protein